MCNENNKCSSNADVLLSIALEETAIAHILNAEGEKIQKAVALDSTVEQLLQINASVLKTVRDVTMLEIVLFNKLETICNGCSPSPVPPQPPQEGQICLQVFCCDSKTPIQNAEVAISRCGEEIERGFTCCDGQFQSSKLCFGEYKVAVCYEEEFLEKLVVIESSDCNSFKVCFKCCKKPAVVICKKGNVFGKVTDKNDCPVKGACILMLSCNKRHSTVTDANGCFVFKEVPFNEKIDIAAKFDCSVSNRSILVSDQCEVDFRVDFIL